MIGMTEKEYRALPEISYSSIKDFDKNRLRFYKKYILQDPNVKEDIEEQESILLGSLVDCLLTGTQADFDAKFASIDTPKKSGQLAEFGDELWKITKKATVDGEVTKEFTEIAEEAFTNVKYNSKGEEVAFKGKDLAKVLDLFSGSQEEMLYKERRDKAGFIVISLDEFSKAQKIQEMLLNTDWSRDLLEGVGCEVHNQLVVQYTINDVPLKSMLDKVFVNHTKKTIQPLDLKISYLVNNFGWSYWKQKYYLQVATYDAALDAWKKANGYEDYTILPMKFLVGDSTCQSVPVIWECSTKNVTEGYIGFVLSSGRKVKGLLELVNEIKWCSENTIWTTPKEIYDNNGVMQIKPFESVEAED